MKATVSPPRLGRTGADERSRRADETPCCAMEEYRRVCRELAVLLDEGRLSEARRLNVEARKLYNRVYRAQPPVVLSPSA